MDTRRRSESVGGTAGAGSGKNKDTFKIKPLLSGEESHQARTSANLTVTMGDAIKGKNDKTRNFKTAAVTSVGSKNQSHALKVLTQFLEKGAGDDVTKRARTGAVSSRTGKKSV